MGSLPGFEPPSAAAAHVMSADRMLSWLHFQQTQEDSDVSREDLAERNQMMVLLKHLEASVWVELECEVIITDRITQAHCQWSGSQMLFLRC